MSLDTTITTIIIADPLPVFSIGLEKTLGDSDLGNLKSYVIESLEELKQEIQSSTVDIVFIDPLLGGHNDIDCIRDIKKINAHLKIIVNSNCSDCRIVKSAFAKGADGYVLKSSMPEEFLKAIDVIQKGKIFMGEGVTLVNDKPQYRSGNGLEMNRLDYFVQKYKITRRELEVLRLIAKALNNKEIAQHLYISDQTVSVHRKNIMRKLNVNSTAMLIKMVYEQNIL